MEILNSVQRACLEKLVGISQVKCNCYPEALEDREGLIKDSKTGMYIDQDDGISSLLLLENVDCDSSDVFEWLIKARENALTDIIILTSSRLSESFEPRLNSLRLLGSNSYSNLLTSESAGTKTVSFKTSNMPGGIIKINEVGFIAKLATGLQYSEIEITIKKNGEESDELPPIQFVIGTNGNVNFPAPDQRTYELEEPLELQTDGSEYSFSYVYDPEEMTMYSTKLVCGTCQAAKNEISHYFKTLPGAEAYGLFFQVQYSCNNNYLLCAILKENKSLEGLAGKMIIYKTLSNFLSRAKVNAKAGLTASNVIKVIDFDSMVQAYEGMFSQALNAFIEEAKRHQFQARCFKCRTGNFARRTGIIY